MKLVSGSLALAALCAALTAQPVFAKDPPVPDYNSLTNEEAIEGCDKYASHPLDPMRPEGVAGVASDADVNNQAAYIYCARAFQADHKNPRLAFQWGRVNHARNPNGTGQPRQMFKLAYRGGSEIAGIYLAQLPPELTDAELQRKVQESIRQVRREQNQRAAARPMTGAERDQLLLGSVIVIGSVALLKILSGEAAPTQECSGGYMLDVRTHAILCNGLVVGQY